MLAGLFRDNRKILRNANKDFVPDKIRCGTTCLNRCYEVLQSIGRSVLFDPINLCKSQEEEDEFLKQFVKIIGGTRTITYATHTFCSESFTKALGFYKSGKRAIGDVRINRLYDLDTKLRGSSLVDCKKLQVVRDFFESYGYSFSHYDPVKFPYAIMSHPTAKKFSDLLTDYHKFCEEKGLTGYQKVAFVNHSKSLYANEIRFERPDLDHCDQLQNLYIYEKCT